jgi:hypothetical protein
MTGVRQGEIIVSVQAWRMPTRTQAAGFWLRTRLLALLRSARNWHSPRARRWLADEALATAPIRAQLRTSLWADSSPEEFVLTAGKVHNLRIAAKAFDGLVVPAGERLSFWRQLGRPTTAHGYVRGREVRAGCVVPILAGGICQISNALATCAVRAGFELVERHAHSVRVESTAEEGDGIDATVFWNYVDLQIRAPVAWRLELKLTSDELVLTIRAQEVACRHLGTDCALPPRTSRVTGNVQVARSCMSCEEVRCFRHHPSLRGSQARSAWLLDGWTQEFHDWLSTQDGAADRLIPVATRQLPGWFLRRRLVGDGKEWSSLVSGVNAHVTRFGWVSLRRAWWLRRHARDAGRRQASVLDGQRWLAEAYARRLRPEHTHLVIDQGLLPYLQQLGVLGGRTYDVLAHALPMDEIQRRLDQAGGSRVMGKHGDAALKDFRTAADLVRAEMEAMQGARKVMTAHAGVAGYWRQRGGVDVRQLPWAMPAPAVSHMPRAMGAMPLVVFPASALARKGAYELAEALRGLSCRLRVLGSVSADTALWQGVAVEYGNYTDDWLAKADAVVLPAHVEHAPRALLTALAAGIPVIATPACGIQDMAGVQLVPAGEVGALRAALQTLLDRASEESD